MAGYGSGNKDRITGARQKIREISKEIATKRKQGKDVSYLRSELDKARNELARVEREEAREIKAFAHPKAKKAKPSWWH